MRISFDIKFSRCFVGRKCILKEILKVAPACPLTHVFGPGLILSGHIAAMIRSTKKLFGLIPLSLLLAGALFVIALFVFSFVAHEVVMEREKVFDERVFAFFHRHVSAGMVSAMRIITWSGSHFVLIPAYCVLIAVYLLRGHRQDALDISIIGFSSLLLLLWLKHIFHRARPDLPLFRAVAGYSFPSGHALSIFIFCALLIHLIRWSRWRPWLKWSVCIFLFLFSILIGISRIVLRVHYPSDVLAGFCMGFAWVTLLLTLQGQLRRKMHIPSDHPTTLP
jgi:undecaprenyl-diphosphatase